ncbi:MAG: acyl-CoA synthetase [Burkholderiales bacterium]|nr:acyl-CoA synthetase [Burkholderiales bacterium]
MSSVAYLRKPPSRSVQDGASCLQDVETIEQLHPDFMGEATSTYALIRAGAAKHPEAPALSFFLRSQDFREPHVWSHRDWLAKITQAANLFRELGIQRGDVVAFILPNLPETHWTIWGGEAAGIAFAINPLLEPAMMVELMNAAKPKLLVTLAPTPGTDIWEKASAAAKSVPSLTQVLVTSPLHYLPGAAAPLLKWLTRLKLPKRLGALPVVDFHKRLARSAGDQLRFQPPALDDVASYFCTGGTTGLPKIAVRTHRTEVANTLELSAMFGAAVQGAGKTMFCGLPLFHVNAQIGTGLTPWAAGAHVVLGTPQGYRAPGLLQQFWDMAAHHRFIFFSGVPTVYSALLLNPPKGQDLSALRYGVCGAAPMPVELFKRFEQETGVKILEGYGLTEGGCVSSINPPCGETRIGSIGVRLPWQSMKTVLLDDQGRYVRDAAVDEVGVIVIQGPNLFKGYLNPAHNKGLWIEITESRSQARLWLNTGDLGRMDAEGYFWLTGRKKELIIRGGHNIDPKMIEEAMHQHPAVALAAAVGRPDPHAGEVPTVYVQLRPGIAAESDELMAHAQRTIAERAAWPKQVQVLPTLPTTAIGKIYKPALSLLELESVVRAEASAAHVTLVSCQAEQDPRLGLVVHWRASGDAASLRQGLSAYTFRHQEGGDHDGPVS